MSPSSNAGGSGTTIPAERALWRNHSATAAQQQYLPFGNGKKRPTQATVLLEMLREARRRGESLQLPAILKAGLAQHSARFNELRERGFQIENEMTRVDGIIHSVYRLLYDPEAGR